MRVAIAVMASFAFVVFAACSDASDETENGEDVPDVTATADLYSGVENPSWVLAHGEAQSVADCLKSDRTGSDNPEADLNLGFRGFLLSSELLSVADITSMRVTSQRVFIEASSGEWAEVSCGGLFDALMTSAPTDVRKAIEEG